MSRVAKTTEQTQVKALNKSVGRLLRRRGWQGDWRLTDNKLTNRRVTWEVFRHANSDVSAISSVMVNGKQWWVVASYSSYVDPGTFLIFGFFGGAFARKRLELQFWSNDPFSLGKPLWDYLNHPDDTTREWVSTRAQFRALTA